VTIRREIETRMGRSIAVGALYTAFDRLERKGLIRSTASDPLPQRGGRSRRQVAITPAGVAALKRAHDTMQRMWAGLSLRALKVRS
jgi:DNA-binding PadR family transcriptional regulator